MPKVYIMV